MKGAALALALAHMVAATLLAAPATAQTGPPLILAGGETLEVETRADFNGDGVPDLAFVATRDGSRELRVVLGFVYEVEVAEYEAQVLPLDSDPLSSAALEVRGNVLLLKDLTGGTTAVASTHRFRWDTKLEAMRLIGLDATLYSRTFAHDGQEASWNLLTGGLLTHTMRLRRDNSDRAYDVVNKRRRKKTSPPLRLEQSPNGAELLGWPGTR